MNDAQVEELRTKYGFDRIGIINGEMYLPVKEVFEKLVQRWIPTDKALPEDDSTCLVTIEYPNEEVMVDFGWFSMMGACWYVGMHQFKNSNVHAWMPLPEAWKEEGAFNE